VRGRPLYYDRKGRPLGCRQWARLFENNPDRYRFVGKTVVGSLLVSTVWLGIDHSFSETGPPLIFETMIFPECEVFGRWPTEEAALAGHDQAVEEMRHRLAIGDQL